MSGKSSRCRHPRRCLTPDEPHPSDLLPADFLRRFCVLGTPDECISRLSALLEVGLSHLVLVGGSRDIDEKIRERSDHLLASDPNP